VPGGGSKPLRALHEGDCRDEEVRLGGAPVG